MVLSAAILRNLWSCLHLKKEFDVARQEIIQLSIAIQIITTASDASLGNLLAIRQSSYHWLDPYDGGS